MKVWLYILLVSILGCQSGVPQVEVNSNSLLLIRKNGLQLFSDQPYSGYILTYSPQNNKLRKEGFLNGKRQGASKSWDENGQLIESRYYSENRKTGRHLGYFSNGQPKFEYEFKNDLPIGRHLEWLENGQIYSISNYDKEGQPEGEQKLYFASGKIRANYVIKDGRRFGLLGAKGCMGENEKSNFALEFNK